jgi:hypothetical protein
MQLPDKLIIDAEVRRCNQIREALLAEYGDDDLDEQTIADTIEGLVNIHEMLAAIVRAALDDAAMAEAIRDRAKDMKARLDRIEARADRLRQIVKNAMADAHIQKLTQPDFTASLRAGQPHVTITDEQAIPESFLSYRPHINKREILDALKDGAEVAGAALSNPEMVLSVRTK